MYYYFKSGLFNVDKILAYEYNTLNSSEMVSNQRLTEPKTVFLTG